MAQTKEQDETPEKELNKTEISNLSDSVFKTLVIRRLKELIGYFNSIKKTQAEKKVTLSEVKKKLQGTNSGMDEAENQINDLEHKEEKTFNQNSKKKKETPQNENNSWTTSNTSTFKSQGCQKQKRTSKKLETYLKT